MGYVEEKMAEVSATTDCAGCLFAMRRLLEEREVVVAHQQKYDGVLPAYWLDAAGLYDRCYEISDHHLDVSLGMLTDEASTASVYCVKVEFRFAGALHVVASPVEGHYPPRLMGTMLLLVHQTLCQLAGILPPLQHQLDHQHQPN